MVVIDVGRMRKFKYRLLLLWVLMHVLVFLFPVVIKSFHFHHHPDHHPVGEAIIETGNEACAICNYEFTQFTDDSGIRHSASPFYAIDLTSSNNVSKPLALAIFSALLRAPPASIPFL
jgi:hypothetical protein